MRCWRAQILSSYYTKISGHFVTRWHFKRGGQGTGPLENKVAVWGEYEATEEGVNMIKWLKRLRDRFFDYDIVGEYYDTIGDGRYRKKYVKRWRLRK